MKVIILGYDGYIGYPLTIHLLEKGYEVLGMDSFVRRNRVADVGSDSLTPITDAYQRIIYLSSTYKKFNYLLINISNYDLSNEVESFQPDAIIHLAEQPSAPWSMSSIRCAQLTQQDNVLGTLNLLWAMKEFCPSAHLIKLGTMGEYGTPDCDIPEGVIPKECIKNNLADWNPLQDKCPMSGLLFPRQPGSFYHASKVMDTVNIEFACRNWGLRSTDIMQGIVFGLIETDDINKQTRFDYDEYFGTVINRFCTQAIIGHPLTIYGSGEQTRGFLPLKDSIQCLTIALENPPEEGEYRTFNQFENIYNIEQLAYIVSEAYNYFCEIEYITNPRIECDCHYYNPTHEKLLNLGYKPTTNINKEISTLLKLITPYKSHVIREVIMPKTKWK